MHDFEDGFPGSGVKGIVKKAILTTLQEGKVKNDS